MKLGSKVKILEGGREISLTSIQTKKKSGDKIITLKDPILIFQQEGKEDLPMYLSEVNRLISWGRWELLNP